MTVIFISDAKSQTTRTVIQLSKIDTTKYAIGNSILKSSHLTPSVYIPSLRVWVQIPVSSSLNVMKLLQLSLIALYTVYLISIVHCRVELIFIHLMFFTVICVSRNRQKCNILWEKGFQFEILDPHIWIHAKTLFYKCGKLSGK